MAVDFGLPDEEIDRLLLEAEVRLSGNGSTATPAVVTAVKAVEAAATVAAPVAASTGEQAARSEHKKSEKLSVRAPQLVQKNKVCAPVHHIPFVCPPVP